MKEIGIAERSANKSVDVDTKLVIFFRRDDTLFTALKFNLIWATAQNSPIRLGESPFCLRKVSIKGEIVGR